MAEISVHPGDPFSFQFALQSPLTRAALVAARPFLSRLAGVPALRDLYRRSRGVPGMAFEASVLRALDIRLRVHNVDGETIPPVGPLVIAANHPTGVRDGLVLAEAVRQVRADVRLLTNHLLSAIPELAGSCYFVDAFAGRGAVERSRAGLRAAHLWLRGGGVLVVFPAGEVAWQGDGDNGRTRTDSEWLSTVGRLVLSTGARVMPVWIDGRNSPAFYGAGRVHPRLRTLLLGRELLKQRGSVAHVFLGKAFGRDAVRAQQTPEAVTKTLRNAVDAIALEAGSVRSTQAIAPAIHSVLLAQDVQRLPATARLIASGVYDVFCAGAQVLPHVLPEIGRLREITFRAVGEGTGLALDLDRFDAHYEHLFVWNRVRCEVVGAYRVGATDRIVAAHGIQGLYTRTLFRYDDRLLRRLSPALELGRSFVRAEYQRSYNALLLLWKGIGHLVARAPDYRVLFGPVSISRRYQDSTQEMLRVFLAEHCSDPALTELVEAVQPPSAVLRPARSAAPVADVDELDAVIRSIERSQGMPVLLRQYLRLNATVLGFNVDPAFGDALDALMMVDLTRLPSATLQRYLGRAEADAFLARHAARTAPQVAA